jgi:hypothetical protein
MLSQSLKGHMPFVNSNGFIMCTNEGVISHEYFGSITRINSWQPKLVTGDLGHLVSQIRGFSVVCNPIIGCDFVSFTGCILEPNRPASYRLYKVTKNGVEVVSRRITFSGFWTPRKEVRISDHNSFTYGKKKTLKSYEQIVRIVPCQDQFLSRFDPLILTVLDERSGLYKSIIYKRSDDSFWRIRSSNGEDVYKPTIYNGLMIHVKKEGSDRALETSTYYLE